MTSASRKPPHSDIPTRDRAADAGTDGLSRRDALKGAGAAAAGLLLGACGPSVRAGPAAVRQDIPAAEPGIWAGASELAVAIRNGTLGAHEAVSRCLDRIDAVNGRLNAVVTLDAEGALAAARAADERRARGEPLGALHGVPMTIKDSLDTAGLVSTGGTLGRRDHVPADDATVVRRLRAAGAILLGKTNTPELTLSFDTDNHVFGRTRNPWNLGYSPGGSSGGAAAIVAAGGSPFDVGSDYGGSIRLPAHVNGICGIKPTAGRVPRTGHIMPYGGIQDSFQQIGPLTRTVADLELILAVLHGPDGADPGALPLVWRESAAVDVGALRVAWFDDNGVVAAQPAIAAAVGAATNALAAAGAAVAADRPDAIESTLDVALPIYFWDGGAGIRGLLERYGTRRNTLGEVLAIEALGTADLQQAHARLDLWRSRMLAFLDRYDVLVCPVNAAPAFTVDGPDDAMMARASYSIAFNVTGWPAAVVPAGITGEGLPIGVQIVAGPGREDRVLAAARVVEAALGGFSPPPMEWLDSPPAAGGGP